jgi:cell division cycle-associated protein 7
LSPVDYMEACGKKSCDLAGTTTALIEEGRREEYYTEEHEKLLGSTELPWTLFVDGYTKDGMRIYDPVKGKTCHQCRFMCFLFLFSTRYFFFLLERVWGRKILVE